MAIVDQKVFLKFIFQWVILIEKFVYVLWVEFWEEIIFKIYLIMCGVTDLDFLD